MTATSTLTARPSRVWEFQTLLLMAAIGAAALLGMVLLVTDLVVRSFVLTDGESGMSPLVRAVAEHAESINLLFFVLAVGYVFGFTIWRRATRNMLSGAGDRAETATTHWTVAAWYLALGCALTIRWMNTESGDSPDAVATGLAWDAVQTSVRLIGLSLLLIGVWQIREQVCGLVAETGVAARRPAVTVRLLPPPGQPAAPSVADLGSADDAFWQRVSQLAGTAGAAVALLEITGPVIRRWALVPPTGDLAAIRAALAPGAIITVFPEPPAATDTTSFVPPPADFYYGFLEDDHSGDLRYQTVSPARIPVFLNRARDARRWALYPTDSPAALRAVVKPA